ncbi:MAG: VOC family protein [Acidimicrobiales bacterium]
MPTRGLAPIGAPCWVDLMTSDAEVSRDFYTRLFGWTAEEPNAEFGGYFNFTKDGVLVAGGMASQPDAGMPDAWSVYLATGDARKTAEMAGVHGGQIVAPPMDVGDLGTMAVVLDPGGAAIGMWQPGLHRGFGILAEPGAPAWFELHTREYAKAVDFYRDVFRWDAHTVPDTPPGFRYTTLGEGDGSMAGIMDASGFLPEEVPAHWNVYFGTADTDAALETIVGLGGSVVAEPEDTPYGRVASAADPIGVQFKLAAND